MLSTVYFFVLFVLCLLISFTLYSAHNKKVRGNRRLKELRVKTIRCSLFSAFRCIMNCKKVKVKAELTSCFCFKDEEKRHISLSPSENQTHKSSRLQGDYTPLCHDGSQLLLWLLVAKIIKKHLWNSWVLITIQDSCQCPKPIRYTVRCGVHSTMMSTVPRRPLKININENLHNVITQT